MEDSHIALTDISDGQIKDFLEAAAAKSAGDANVSLFGVFDGHGGKYTTIVIPNDALLFPVALKHQLLQLLIS